MILQRYVCLNLLKGWLLALVVLGAVFGLITFTAELDSAERDYDALAAATYTLSVLPNQLIELAPVIALMGSIIAFASLGRFNELTVMSASGFSLSRLLSAILLPTLVLMLILWAAMEYFAPQLQQAAEQTRRELRQGDTRVLPGGGVWSSDDRRYIHLGAMSQDNQPAAISLFEFDDAGRLVRHVRAREAQVNENRDWLFLMGREKRLQGDELTTRTYRELTIDKLWSADELPSLRLQRDTMNLSVLYRYTQYLAGTDQSGDRYLHTFWQKLLMPLTVLAMVLLATPLSASVSAGRDRSLGMNVGIGAVLGILFYLGAQVIFALGQLFQWNIPLVAALPAIIIALCAVLMLARMRW